VAAAKKVIRGSLGGLVVSLRSRSKSKYGIRPARNLKSEPDYADVYATSGRVRLGGRPPREDRALARSLARETKDFRGWRCSHKGLAGVEGEQAPAGPPESQAHNPARPMPIQ
jgi:hypothetical protein